MGKLFEKLADLHTHTSLCKHASGRPEDYLQAAAKAGLSRLGVSDHCPWPALDPRWHMDGSQFPLYAKIVDALRASGAEIGIEVLYALEIDYAEGQMLEAWAKIADEPLDYVIGSVHYIDGFPMDNPESKDKWVAHGGPDCIWIDYAKLLLDFVKRGGFQIIGHCDLPKKFSFYPSSLDPFHRTMAEVFEAAAANGIAIELNTAGLRKPVKEIYPSLTLLKLARAAGVKITLGSDAHAPDEVACDFDKALELAKAAGYRSALYFKRRQPFEYAL